MYISYFGGCQSYGKCVEMQRALLTAAVLRSGSGRGMPGALEAHGTGTALGDPTEVAALAQTVAERLGADVAARSGGLIINTSGWVDGPGYESLL